jgi:hypothetical protein
MMATANAKTKSPLVRLVTNNVKAAVGAPPADLGKLVTDIGIERNTIGYAETSAREDRKNRDHHATRAATFRARAASADDPILWASLTAKQKAEDQEAGKYEASALTEDKRSDTARRVIARLRKQIVNIRADTVKTKLTAFEITALLRRLRDKKLGWGTSLVVQILANEGHGATCVSTLAPEHYAAVAAKASALLADAE